MRRAVNRGSVVQALLARHAALGARIAVEDGLPSRGRRWSMQFRVTADAELRQRPNRSARVIATLPAGTVVERAGKRDHRWMPVRQGNLSGWMLERLLESVAEPAPNGGQPATGGDIVEIIRQAAREYGQPEEDLLRVGRCESNLDPRAVNPAGPYYGLFQFLRSTWASTPFADRDIFDPAANAQAAAWMWQQGRRGEWACQ
jgi:soluble lytic murein transglycosylase-like protein